MKIQIVLYNRVFKFVLMGLVALLLGTFAFLTVEAMAVTPALDASLRKGAEGKLVLLDFYSPFCGTCQMVEAQLAELKEQTKNQLEFKRIDVTRPGNEKYFESYGLKGTPTYVLYNTAGTPIYRMEEMISPQVLKNQLLRAVGKLEQVSIPREIQSFPASAPRTDGTMNELVLVSFENNSCKPCKKIAPYLNGFEMTGQEGLHIVRLDTQTPGGRKMMESLAIKSAPAYVLLDNQTLQSAPATETSSKTAQPDSRGELFRLEGEVSPSLLWDVIRSFGQSGV